ncbi:MAG: flagellar motor stator protein MotA [Alphaproteobacteria bacterium]|nr:flagellar motor stator protein MotA [Alphaproteobacteria bacterium]
MLAAVGFVVLLVMVFGGFALTGGSLGPVLAAMPHEMMIIGGAAAGALLIGNSLPDLKMVGAGVARIFKGPRYARADFLAAIFLTVKLMRLLKSEGAAALEAHVEDPRSSALFGEQPKLLADPFFVAVVTDTLRLVVVSSGSLNVHAVEEVANNAIRTHHHEALKPVETLQGLSDALPALGIVAAVLGVVKTMGSIDQPPAVLGAMIGAALVGTFLGVLLAYGIVGPLATRLKRLIELDGEIYETAKAVIVASLHNNPQPLVIEAARTSISHGNQPSFADVFDGLRAR